MIHKNEAIHNKYAPYWAAAMFVFALVGVSTTWKYYGNFWNGYILDITGPAWNYILFRGLFTKYSESKFRRLVSPNFTFLLCAIFCVGTEIIQYMGWYSATYDRFDFIAYFGLLIPLFILDTFQNRLMRN